LCPKIYTYLIKKNHVVTTSVSSLHDFKYLLNRLNCLHIHLTINSCGREREREENNKAIKISQAPQIAAAHSIFDRHLTSKYFLYSRDEK
jgi:DNA polymerase elongation subunit (family B)